MSDLLHGDERWLGGPSVTIRSPDLSMGGISSEEEERQLEEANTWIKELGLPPGILSYDFADPETRDHKAVFDLAWPNGIQTNLSQRLSMQIGMTLNFTLCSVDPKICQQMLLKNVPYILKLDKKQVADCCNLSPDNSLDPRGET